MKEVHKTGRKHPRHPPPTGVPASVEPPSTEAETRERVLDAAEALFAEKGLDGTSVREITAAARANLAAVHYYFQSKDALFLEVCRRRIRQVNDRRYALLKETEAHGAPTVEDVVDALVRPAFELARVAPLGGLLLTRMIRRHVREPDGLCGPLMAAEIAPMLERFGTALRRALPGLSPARLSGALHFVIGAMLHSLMMLALAAEAKNDPRFTEKLATHDAERQARDLVKFAAAGLRGLAGEK